MIELSAPRRAPAALASSALLLALAAGCAAPPAVTGAQLEAMARAWRPDVLEERGSWETAGSLYAEAGARYRQEGRPESEAYCAYSRAWCLQPSDGEGTSEEWATVRGLYLEAARLHEAAGNGKQRGRSLHQAAVTLCPRFNPTTNDWEAAALAYGEAAEVRGAAGDPKGRGRSLHEQAWCLEPKRNAARTDWGEPARLYAEAARLKREAGDHEGAAKSLNQQARCSRPDVNPTHTAWTEAAALHGEAAAEWGRVGNQREQGWSLHDQAWCLTPAKGKGTEEEWSRAADLFLEAGRLRGTGGDEAGRAKSLQFAAWCLRPDSGPSGDWDRAIAVYAEAALSAQAGGNAKLRDACEAARRECFEKRDARPID